MKLLLDTHVLVWMMGEPKRIGKKSTSLLTDTSNSRYVSSVTVLELSQLVYKAKISLDSSLELWIARAAESLQLLFLDLDVRAARAAYELPAEFHPDPADRLLVAQARNSALTIVTADERILAFPQVSSLDAKK